MKESDDMSSKCLICNKNSCNDLHDIFDTRSKYSNTCLYVFIERFTKLNLRDLGKSEICDICIKELNSFDSAELKCLRIQDEILKLFNDTLKNSLKCELDNSEEFSENFFEDVVSNSESIEDQKIDVDTSNGVTEAEPIPEHNERKLRRTRNSTQIIENDSDTYQTKKVKIERKVRVKKEPIIHECEICQKQFKTKGIKQILILSVVSNSNQRVCPNDYEHKYNIARYRYQIFLYKKMIYFQ